MPRRFEFTRTELVFTAVALGLLTALLFPSTIEDRRPRRAACLNNLKQLALATLAQTMSGRSEIPGYLKTVRRQANPTQLEKLVEEDVSWAAMLLPQLDEQATWAAFQSGRFNRHDDAPSSEIIPNIPIFRCPSDDAAPADSAALSYVINSGAPDYATPNSSRPSDYAANGVSHDRRNERFGPVLKLGSSDFADGADRTILFSENIDRDPPSDLGGPGNTWLRPDPKAKNLEQWYGMNWVFDPANPDRPSPKIQERFGALPWHADPQDRPFAKHGPRFARPSSNHPDVFLVAFCGGNVRELSVDIDYRVYQQLMTPDGRKCVWPENPTVELPKAFRNADPTQQLDDSDLDR